MHDCSGMRDSGRVRFLLLITGLIIVSLMATGVRVAQAEMGQARDRVYGDEFEVLWSEGEWTSDGSPVPGCLTFPGGISTGPGSTFHADSVLCDPAPNGWHWSVTIPGPHTIDWDSDNIPIDVEVCVQIFYSAQFGALSAAADLASDWLIVRQMPDGVVLYQGPLSTFDPQQEGFVVTEARRCGKVTLMPVPNETRSWGLIKQIYR